MTPAQGIVPSLRVAWQARKTTSFHDWVRAVASQFELSGLSLEAAAQDVSTNPAELEAVLRLALLDDEELEAIGSSPPPPTTWFLLASMDAAGIREALTALQGRRPGQSPSSVLRRFDPDEALGARVEKVSMLEADVFYALAAKAKRYGLLNDNGRKALFDFGRRRKSGKPLSEKQANWADGMITDLISGGAIQRNSPDDDREMCDSLLDLFEK